MGFSGRHHVIAGVLLEVGEGPWKAEIEHSWSCVAFSVLCCVCA